MKTKITVGAVLLLTLGSALGGSAMYQKGKVPAAVPGDQVAITVDTREVTPEMISDWKATALTAEYSPPMLPM